MANRPILRARRSLAAGAVVLVGVVAAPATASADDGAAATLPVSGVPSVPDVPSVPVAADPEGAVEAIVDDVLGDSTKPEESAPAASTAGEDDGAAPAEPEPAADAEAPQTGTTATDTAPVAADTTADTPTGGASGATAHTAAATSSSTAAPAVTQVAPTNVNVSIRIGSPGDNGSVTQANVAVAAATSGPAGATGATTQSTSAGSTAPAKAPAAPVSPPASPAISPSTTGEGVWDWQWDCASAPDFSGWYPTTSDSGIAPSTWIWNWNCGENSSQYQTGASTDQQRPVNVNVGIRIASPGNDGPVIQANIAVAVGVGGPHVPTPAAAPVGAGVADVTPGAADPGPGVGLVAPVEIEAAASPGELVVAAAPLLEDGVEPSHGAHASLGRLPLKVLGSPGGRSGLAPVLAGLSGRGLVSLRPVSIRRWSAPGDATGRTGSHGPEKGTAKAAHWRLPAPGPGGITRVSSGTSVAPAGAGGSSSGGLPLVLALPFLAAVLDMARRLALDRVATPSGHRSRVPDDPG